mmetsp:Transcript_6082/g.23416  ORF Transcript_6082/g.23416 Transcript_6082/m.23416 type:complete len:156 (-) Transcript_6082:81-548(-)
MFARSRSASETLIKETENFPADLFAPSFFVVKNSVSSCKYDNTEQTRRKQAADPVFDISVRKIISGAYDTTFVDTPVKLYNDLARSMIIDVFELVDVAVLLHDLKKLDHDFGNGAHKNLALSTLFGVVHSLQSIIENADTNHDYRYRRLLHGRLL